MKYIVCEKPGKFYLKDKALPSYGEGEALLKIRRIGICGTDLHAFRGNQPFFSYPRILGHELAATVEAAGNKVSRVRAGDRVVVMPYLSCGRCVACRQGKTNCCAHLQVLGVHADGGMQEKIAVPADILIPANDLSYDEIAVVEPLSIGAHALRRADLKEGETIVVAGCGPIGLGLMKLAQLRGATVIALDVDDRRLSFAESVMGINHIIDARKEPAVRVAEITGGEMATAVFDATGNRQALESGVDFMAHGGRYILVGLSREQLSFHHPLIHAKETSLLCSRNATLVDFHTVIDLLRTGQFPIDAYITHRVAFAEMIDHFESWLRPETGVIKAMVEL